MAKKKLEEVEEVLEEVLETIEETPKEKLDNHKIELELELKRLYKLHGDLKELGINADSKLEILIQNLDNEIKKL